jgi:hypothetical protein
MSTLARALLPSEVPIGYLLFLSLTITGCTSRVIQSSDGYGLLTLPPTMAADVESEPLLSQEETEIKMALLEELDKNRDKWGAQGISSYKVTLEEQWCYCLFGPYYGPVRIIVKNGRIRRATYLGEARDGYFPGDILHIETPLRRTIDEIFEVLESTIRRASSEAIIRVEYDSELGFPSIIEYDNPHWHHDESRLVVTNFRARKTR